MCSKQDRREGGGGVARVVTRGPGAFWGPERHIFNFFFVFSFPQGTSLGQRAHWPSKLSLHTEIKKDFSSKIVFPTVYRRACPPKSSVLPVNLRAWSKRKMAWPKKFFDAFPLALEGPFCSQPWGPVRLSTALAQSFSALIPRTKTVVFDP